MARLVSIFVAGVMLLHAAGQQTIPEAFAQSANVEAQLTAGATTENVTAAATQVKAFGDFYGWHYYGDGSFAAVHGDESDAFGAAYPYDSGARLMELKAEKIMVSGQRLLGVRVGRYRTPFGIYSGSDQGYLGFLRAPLMRNSYYWALSNNFLEKGASVTAGTTWLNVEVSTSAASDEDEMARRGGVNNVVRVQGAHGSWIAGASYIRTRPSEERTYALGRTEFAGADFRWMKRGVQVRGELIEGRPFLGARTRAGYVDFLVHKVFMGPVTAVARLERLDYFAGPFSEFPRRYTVGAKIRISQALTAQVNYVRQPLAASYVPDQGHKSLDVALTYNIRAEGLLSRQGR